jgi:proteasome lid subunit RPN8/RPN11
MLAITNDLIGQINSHVEEAYPEEGAGFLIGVEGEVKQILPLPNAREDEARHNRFLITPEDYREWAQPFFSYIITRVDMGKPVSHRSWRLVEDRSKYEEEEISIQ